jgi:hypothetical protein
VPEVANDPWSNLQLLDDLPQLASLVEQVEDAGGDATLLYGRACSSDGSLRLHRGDLGGIEQPAARSAHGVQLVALLLRTGKMLR